MGIVAKAMSGVTVARAEGRANSDAFNMVEDATSWIVLPLVVKTCLVELAL